MAAFDLVGLACLTLWGLVMLGGHGANRVLAFAVSGIVFALAVAGLFLFPAIARGLWGRWPGLPARGLALRVADAFPPRAQGGGQFRPLVHAEGVALRCCRLQETGSHS